MAWELVILDSGARVPLEVGKEYVVGSGSSVHVKLSARDVSGSHAIITVYPTFVRVVDLGSKNGTFHKGKRVPVAEVVNGETVAFSSVKVQFLQTGTETGPPPPRAFVEKEASHTGEYPVAAVDSDLAELLESWDTAPEQACAALLSWLVRSRRLAAAALLQTHGDDVVVLAAQGLLPTGLAGSKLSPVLRRHSQELREVLEVPESSPPAFLCPVGQVRSLLLVVGTTKPSSRELSLLGRLARLACRLSGL